MTYPHNFTFYIVTTDSFRIFILHVWSFIVTVRGPSYSWPASRGSCLR